MDLLPITDETIKKVRKELNLDEKRVKESLEHINDWLGLQPHLPKENDDDRLERWLIRCKNSMEKTKQTLDMYYTLRTTAPEIMCGWDVNDPWFDVACNVSFFLPMPTLTEDLDRILIWGYMEEHANFEFIGNLKLILLISELRMREEYNLKDIYVIDMRYFTLADCQKMSLPMIKKFEVCVMGGYNTRLRALHFVNTPSYTYFLVNFMKSIMKSKLVERIYVHGEDLTEFHKQVPKNLLPTELGGSAGRTCDHWRRWEKKLRSNRDWLLSREQTKTDESKRPYRKMNDSELFGFEGSFRKLAID